MEFSEITKLIELFEEGTIREFDLKHQDIELYLSKNQQGKMSRSTTGEPAQSASVPAEQEAVQAEEKPTPAAGGTAETGKTVNSPIVGVAYLSSDPGKPPFKKAGDRVEVGDTLCIVEAMKIMNEITSDVTGTVSEILVTNEEVVEYGQPLFRIV